MFDSDKTMSDESEEEDEEDESSMMNWVMPLSQVPCLENQNNLFNNQFNKVFIKASQRFIQYSFNNSILHLHITLFNISICFNRKFRQLIIYQWKQKQQIWETNLRISK